MNTAQSARAAQTARLNQKIPVQLAGVDEESQSTAQESTPVPYAAGENIAAARWISPIYNQFARIAPEEARGKK
jgi:hypothetical protein